MQREKLLRRHRQARERLARQHEAELRALDEACVRDLLEVRASFALEWSPTTVLEQIVSYFDMRDLGQSTVTCRLLGERCPRAASWPRLALQRFPWLRELLGPRRVQTTSVETYRNLCRRQVEAQNTDLGHYSSGTPSILTCRPCASHADFALLDDVVASIELVVKAPQRRVVFEASALPRFNAESSLVIGPFWTPNRGPPGLASYCLNDRPAGDSWAQRFPELTDWLGDAPRATGAALALTIYVSRRSLLSTVKLYEAQVSDEAMAQRALHFAHARAPATCRLVTDLLCLAPSLDLQTGQIHLAAYRRPPRCPQCATLALADTADHATPPPPSSSCCGHHEDLGARDFLTYLTSDLPWGVVV